MRSFHTDGLELAPSPQPYTPPPATVTVEVARLTALTTRCAALSEQVELQKEQIKRLCKELTDARERVEAAEELRLRPSDIQKPKEATPLAWGFYLLAQADVPIQVRSGANGEWQDRMHYMREKFKTGFEYRIKPGFQPNDDQIRIAASAKLLGKTSLIAVGWAD